jgi:hypothetical protein
MHIQVCLDSTFVRSKVFVFLRKKLYMYTKDPPEIYEKRGKHTMLHADVEIAILKLFRKTIIEKNITPCILELVTEHICEGLDELTPTDKVCENLLTTSDDKSPATSVRQLLCAYQDMVRNGIAHDKLAFMVLERCDMSLDDFLLGTTETPVFAVIFKSILFQIIYTMYAINEIYPKFRHNDLHSDNIMLKFDQNYRFNPTDPKFLVFHVGGKTFNVPYFGIIAKIIDFGFSVLPEEGIISSMTEDRIMSYYRGRLYNDMMFLFYWIYRVLDASRDRKLMAVDKILSALDPDRNYVYQRPGHVHKIESTAPSYKDMVKNKIFDEYSKHTITQSQIYAEYSPVHSKK